MSQNSGKLSRYVDLPWYRKVAGYNFSSVADATEHYRYKGEALGNWPNPLFDPIFYRQQLGLVSEKSSLLHFLTDSSSSTGRPSLFFDREWYEWQNPDFAETGCGLLHYLEIGGKQYRDPCPEVDMTSLSRTHGNLGDGSLLTHLLTTGQLPANAVKAVTKDNKDLVRRQREFLRKIRFNLVKNRTSALHGKNLLFVQCANNSNFWTWFDERRKRDWDLFLNCYAGDLEKAHVAEYVCKQAGTKFTGILNCWLNCHSFLDLYENIFFIDDDIIFNFEDISFFFRAMASAGLDLAQPSLSPTSHCIWQVFFNKKKTGSRKTNGIEIMMPALSKRARDILLPYFIYSTSGFGLDLLMGKLASIHQLNVGVIDDIVANHGKMIDQSNGAYYEFLRRNNINSRYELWRIIKMFQTDHTFYEVD